ncbi:MAG: sugar phosphate isomerase/epimerase family protein [Actinomycetota bacterium]|nr:sugar phosphate isomerase/epimerase family protein [Actinomycetota bacterium]
MIALSTCWQSTLAQSGRDLIAGLRSLGFSQIELEYRITPEMLVEIKPALAAGEIQPVSIHNYFPAPKVAPQPGGEIWSFSSEDADERQTAVGYTKQAIDIAGELGAKALVVHCGQVTIDPRTAELRDLFDAGQIEAPPGRRVVDEIKKAREAKIGPALERVRDCLEPLAEAAHDAGVKLGLENRYYSHEIPNSEDLAFLLPAVGNGSIGYWHDVGHAAVQENLGLDSQASLLGRFRDRVIGVHLHDARGYKDHLTPGTGEVDFSFIRENLPGDIIQVLEVQPSVTPRQIRAGLDHLAAVGIS